MEIKESQFSPGFLLKRIELNGPITYFKEGSKSSHPSWVKNINEASPRPHKSCKNSMTYWVRRASTAVVPRIYTFEIIAVWYVTVEV